MVLHHIGNIAEGSLAAGETGLLLSIMTNRCAYLLNFPSKKTERKIANLAMIPQMMTHAYAQHMQLFSCFKATLCV
jgi:hypothetical protein